MIEFRYKYGDRPLEGYTVQRAAGRGGFGEVYYAISDSGRQVALKAIQNYEQIELRGITQCMNLKSPHLVTIFDVKHNERNEPFVIMEYVSGPSLRDLLRESPGGLGPQKAAFFLREIGKGLSFLHDCGIVHRDLKPSNIFYENGYVKIGDYGLTKAISASRHSGHTITVGTVHYMAPEIGAGSYDRSIDIYALGVLLYEMLTGQVPFDGASPAEVLMKHMTATPELDHIEGPFARVIRKALAKDPSDRYKTVQAMVEELFGEEHIRNSVSQFSPEELSVIAEYVAEKAKLGAADDARKRTASIAEQGAEDAAWNVRKTAEQHDKKMEAIGDKFADRVDQTAKRFTKSPRQPHAVVDPVTLRQRHRLAVMTMALVALGAGILNGQRGFGLLSTGLCVFMMIGACATVILLSRRHWFSNLEPESRWIGKVATCLLAALVAALLSSVFGGILDHGRLPRLLFFPFPRFFRAPTHSFIQPGGTWLSLVIPMILVDWWRITSPQRSKRVSLGHALWLGLLGYIAAQMFDTAPLMMTCVLAGTSLVVQVATPFGPAIKSAQPEQAPRAVQAVDHKRRSRTSAIGQPVPPFVRVLWFVGFLVTLGLGLILVIQAAVVNLRDEQFALSVAFGINSLILSLCCFVKVFRDTFTGWYRYLIRPLLLILCVETIITSFFFMGGTRLNEAQSLLAVFLIVFPTILFFVIAFIPPRIFDTPAPKSVTPGAPAVATTKTSSDVSSYKRFWALLLSEAGLFGICGLQRFYVGKIGTGILWLLTGGILWIGQLIDIIMIVVGQFKDRYGLPLVNWYEQGTAVSVAGGSDIAQPAESPAPAHQTPIQKAHPGETDQSPAQGDPAVPAVHYVPTTTVVYEPFHPLSLLFSAVGYLLAVAALLVGLAIALHLPVVLASGWPDPDLPRELDRIFGDPNWPSLLERLGTMLFVVIFSLSAVCLIVARRHLGGRHILRAVLGLSGFLFALFVLMHMLPEHHLQGIVETLKARRIGPAIDTLLRVCAQGEAIFALILILASVVMLSWPPRRREPIFGSVPNQGVS